MSFLMIDWEQRAKSAELAREETLSFVAAILVAAGLEGKEIRISPMHLENGPLIVQREKDPKDGAIVVRVERRHA